jgi:dTDP-4-dehydrorhamnose 3,5-epimerase
MTALGENGFQKSTIEGVWTFKSKVHKDIRGSTWEWFNNTIFSENFSNVKITQLLTAESKKHVIRGIHFSARNNPQYKIVKCTYGSILDVAIDLRRESRTFGQYEVFSLNSTDPMSIMIPEGVGHGYQVISKTATVEYALQTNFQFEEEYVINPFDKFLNIPWKGRDFILSDRDLNGKNFYYFFG